MPAGKVALADLGAARVALDRGNGHLGAARAGRAAPVDGGSVGIGQRERHLAGHVAHDEVGVGGGKALGAAPDRRAIHQVGRAAHGLLVIRLDIRVVAQLGAVSTEQRRENLVRADCSRYFPLAQYGDQPAPAAVVIQLHAYGLRGGDIGALRAVLIDRDELERDVYLVVGRGAALDGDGLHVAGKHGGVAQVRRGRDGLGPGACGRDSARLALNLSFRLAACGGGILGLARRLVGVLVCRTVCASCAPCGGRAFVRSRRAIPGPRHVRLRNFGGLHVLDVFRGIRALLGILVVGRRGVAHIADVGVLVLGQPARKDRGIAGVDMLVVRVGLGADQLGAIARLGVQVRLDSARRLGGHGDRRLRKPPEHAEDHHGRQQAQQRQRFAAALHAGDHLVQRHSRIVLHDPSPSTPLDGPAAGASSQARTNRAAKPSSKPLQRPCRA